MDALSHAKPIQWLGNNVGRGDRVNGLISNRAEIRAANLQLQYLLQFYPYNLKVMFEPFAGTL